MTPSPQPSTPLLPCPFCGGKYIEEHPAMKKRWPFHSEPKLEELTAGGWRVCCYGCHVQTWDNAAPTADEAIKIWNTRAAHIAAEGGKQISTVLDWRTVYPRKKWDATIGRILYTVEEKSEISNSSMIGNVRYHFEATVSVISEGGKYVAFSVRSTDEANSKVCCQLHHETMLAASGRDKLRDALKVAQEALSTAYGEMDEALPIKGSEEYVAFACNCLHQVQEAMEIVRAAIAEAEGEKTILEEQQRAGEKEQSVPTEASSCPTGGSAERQLGADSSLSNKGSSLVTGGSNPSSSIILAEGEKGRCPDCDGTKVKWVETDIPCQEWMPTKEPCPTCKGEGRV